MEQKDYRLAAIMYTDISGFSRMMEKDETATLALLSWHNDLIASVAEARNGTVIKTIGDANLVDFRNTVDAVRAAVEIQDRILARNLEGKAEPLMVRIGVHLGDIYFFENDALGEGINIAARLQSIARPGCIVLSQDVHNLARNKFEYSSRPLGQVPLKNISKEIVAFELESGNVRFLPDELRNAGGATPGPATPQVPPSPARSPEARPAEVPAIPSGPDRDYTETASRGLLEEIRSSILADIRKEGRRLSVREARRRYGYYGVEAAEVIAALAESGILVRDLPPAHESSARNLNEAVTAPASNAASDIGRSIENAVHGIVSEIERSFSDGGDKDSESRGRRRDIHREIRRARRNGDLHLDGEDIRRIVKAGKEGWRESSRAVRRSRQNENSVGAFDQYRKKLAEKAEKLKHGLGAHLVTFLAVNAGLWFLNLGTSSSFLWAAIVSAAWGIGLVGNIVDARRASGQAAEAEALPELDDEALAEYKQINKERDSMSGHVTSAIMVPFLLGTINLLTSPSSLWFLIPSGALLVSLLIHAGTWFSSMPSRLKRFFGKLGIKGGRKGLGQARHNRESIREDLGPYAEQYRQADSAIRELEASIAESKDPAGAEMKPDLERYLGQVRLLAQSANEIDRIVEAMPMAELARDKARLSEKAASAPENMKAVYATSIEEIEKQERSCRDLVDQKEVLALRLDSSVNQLNQMRLDLARVRAVGAGEGPLPGESALARIRDRADELSQYIEDMRTGRLEAQTDPFAELERLAAEKESETASKIASAETPSLEGPRA